MKTLLTGIATFIALGTALPAFANDVTSDRYAPGRADRPRPAATSTVTASDHRQADEAKRAHCTCERSTRDERPAAPREERDGH
jgi:hypothetical protein